MLQQLQQLTYLELGKMFLQGPAADNPALQPLQLLTCLRHLCIDGDIPERKSYHITASMLSGNLSHLELHRCRMEPSALAGKTCLQHMVLSECTWVDCAMGLAQVLSDLHHMQQLTHLALDYSLLDFYGTDSSAAAFSALTASSNLRHLDISGCMLPIEWQHVFPTGRRLPHLRSLILDDLKQPPCRLLP
jgi:hypothetical protein